MDADLYRADESASRLVLYRGSDYPLTTDDLQRLRERGVSRLFIESDRRDDYQQYLRKMVFESDSESSLPVSARTEALGSVVRDILESAFAGGDANETIQSAHELGTLTANILSEDTFAASDLSRVLSHDYATFTHSANVAFYAGVLAKHLGYSKEDIQQITTGGLIHDLGKLEIDDKILSKPGRLDDREFREIKRHPTLGFVQVAERSDLNRGQLMMVYQHHERLDGGGYPVGVTANEIHPWAKICTVVDVFEALTSHRPYRTPMPKVRALELMQRDLGTAFDPEIFACWEEITRNCWHN